VNYCLGSYILATDDAGFAYDNAFKLFNSSTSIKESRCNFESDDDYIKAREAELAQRRINADNTELAAVHTQIERWPNRLFSSHMTMVKDNKCSTDFLFLQSMIISNHIPKGPAQLSQASPYPRIISAKLKYQSRGKGIILETTI
jgi:hypothetical protein